jgi:hypothetical protein
VSAAPFENIRALLEANVVELKHSFYLPAIHFGCAIRSGKHRFPDIRIRQACQRLLRLKAIYEAAPMILHPQKSLSQTLEELKSPEVYIRIC